MELAIGGLQKSGKFTCSGHTFWQRLVTVGFDGVSLLLLLFKASVTTMVCAALTTLSPNLQALSCRVTVSFQFWNNQLSSGIKYQRKAYLIVYSSWQWTNKLTFIKTFQNTAGLIWCVQYAVQTFDKCISFVEKQVWPDHVMCFRECFCKLPPPNERTKSTVFHLAPEKFKVSSSK